MTDEVMRYLEKADHALVVAQDLMAQGHLPDAAAPCRFAPRLGSSTGVRFYLGVIKQDDVFSVVERGMNYAGIVADF